MTFLLVCLLLYIDPSLRRLDAQPAQQTTNSLFAKSTDSKLKLVNSPWETTVRVINLDSSSGTNRAQEIPARLMLYEGASSGAFNVVAFRDPASRRHFVFPGDENIFVIGHTNAEGFFVMSSDILWSGSYVHVTDPEQGFGYAISQFENQFDSTRVDEFLNKRVDESIDLSLATPLHFFSDGPMPGGPAVQIRVEHVTVTKGILDIEIRNPRTQQTAKISINLDDKRIVRSLIGTNEMDLGTSNRPYATPSPMRRNFSGGSPIDESEESDEHQRN